MHPIATPTATQDKVRKGSPLKHGKHQALQQPNRPLVKQPTKEGKKRTKKLERRSKNHKSAFNNFDDQLCPICDDICTCAEARTKNRSSSANNTSPIVLKMKQPVFSKKCKRSDVLCHFDLDDLQDYDLTESEDSDYASLLFDSEGEASESLSSTAIHIASNAPDTLPLLQQPQPIYPRLSETFYKRRPSVDLLFDTFLFDDFLQPLVLESSGSETEFDLAPGTDDPLPITAPQILAALSQAAKPDPIQWYFKTSHSDPCCSTHRYAPPVHSGTIVNGQFIPSINQNAQQQQQQPCMSDIDSDSSLAHHTLETYVNLPSSDTDMDPPNSLQDDTQSSISKATLEELAIGLQRWSRIPVTAFRRRQFSGSVSPAPVGPFLKPSASRTDATLLAHPMPTRKIIHAVPSPEPARRPTRSLPPTNASILDLDPLNAFHMNTPFYYMNNDDYLDGNVIAPPPPPLLGMIPEEGFGVLNCQEEASAAVNKHGSLFTKIDWDSTAEVQ